MIHQATRNHEQPYRKLKRAERAPKLNVRSLQVLFCHTELFPHDSLAALGTPFKSGSQLSCETIRSYLKAAGFL